ncbi:MAG: FtsX-like permease family protein, partial [Vicinamibacterales bacterium]
PLDRNEADLASWTARALDVIGRLAKGATLQQANLELQAIEARNVSAAPAAHAGHHVHVDALRKDYYYAGSGWRSLYFFLAAAAIVLLLACGNVAHLLLARALRRQQEFAIRGALGGGRTALARQLAIEGALVAAPGVAIGVLCSSWILGVVATRIPAGYVERAGPLTLDFHTAIFAAAVAAIATMALALAPLAFARRIDLNPMLGHAARTAGGPPRQARLRHALVIAQMTMTLVLLTGAGLFIVSFVKLTRMPLGFEPADRLAVRFEVGQQQRGDDAFVRAFSGRVLDTTAAVPGVAAAAVASSSPLGSAKTASFVAADRTRPPAGDEPWALFRAVSPAYFQALGIHLLAGRAFTPADGPGAPRVAIVNEHLARRFFPDARAIGQRLDLLPGRHSTDPGEIEIVGIAPHVKDLGMNEVDFDDVYVPFAQAPSPYFELLVHAAITPASVAPALTRAVGSVDPSIVTGAMTTFSDRVDRALANDRFNMELIVSFGAVAILLAFVGIYGTMAYAMEARTREFGVRLVLGATPAEILGAALWRSARLGIAGAILGACTALMAARLLGSALYLVPGVHGGLLYGVSAANPAVLSVAMAALIAVAVLAGLVPARHAMRVDPAVTLRE